MDSINSMEKINFYSAKGEVIGKILGKVSCRKDGSILLGDILHHMTKMTPVLKSKDLGNLNLVVCPEGYWKKMEPYQDEFIESYTSGPTTRMKDTDEYQELVDAFDKGEKAVLSADFVDDYLGVDMNSDSEHLDSLEFIIYARNLNNEIEYNMTLYDKNMKKEQETLRSLLAEKPFIVKEEIDFKTKNMDVDLSEKETGEKVLLKKILGKDDIPAIDDFIRAALYAMVNDLDDIEKQYIYLRFGLEDSRMRSFDEAVTEMGFLLPERVKMIEEYGLRKLRNPIKKRLLESVCETRDEAESK